MDIVEAMNEFQDWEFLQPISDSEPAPVGLAYPSHESDEIDSGGLIQVNYFSLDGPNRYGEFLVDGDDHSAESDNPSWIDPGTEENPIRYLNKDSGEFWTDSSSERSEDRKFSETVRRKEMGFFENEKKEVGSEASMEVDSAKFDEAVKNAVAGVEGSVNLTSDPEVVLGEGTSENDLGNDKVGGPDKRSCIVWWKMPIEFLKYCVFRMSPAWTISIAAAVMGFLFLGRRLYEMKKKKKNSRGLQIKVAVNDKKVSQVMSRAARLNEAFSVVKRVPMIRPSLPAVGAANTFPAMGLR